MIDWNRIDTVILDMDGTLLDLNFDNQFWLRHVPESYARKKEMDLQQAYDWILPKMQAIRGTLDWYDIHYWSRELELDILELKQDMAHLIQPRPGIYPFLESLMSQGKRLWLATNAHEDTISFKFSRVDLSPYLHQVISSNQLGAPKESIEFWQRLNEKIPFEASTSLFIDDNLDVLRAAKRYGIAHLLSIRLPDLSGQENLQNEFPALSHFDEITPTSSAHSSK